MRRLIVVGMLLLVTAMAACAGPADGETRNINVTMTDDLRYDPGDMDADVGETVRFVVHNAGATPHEFLIGTAEEQTVFEEEMAGGHGDRHGSEAGVSVDPGGTSEFTYTFESPGGLFVGCHEPGHYAGGMVAEVTVGS